MKRFLYTFVALCLLAERDGFFEGKYETPLRWVGVLLYESKFVVMPVVDACILFLLLGSVAVARTPDPMLKAVYASIAAIAISAAWGLLNGGSASLVLYAFIRPSSRAIRNAIAIGLLIVLAIYFNNRRIAYVSLISALAVCYATLPASPLKQRINRRLLPLVPLLVLYVAVGWGRTETIFKPLASLSSVNSEETDASAKSRENENMGLIVTFGRNPWLGTGWGHPFIEIDDTLAPKHFSQYRYLPHNSVLGVLAFNGILGFAGIWMVFPLCTLLAARAIQQSRSPTLRLLGLGTLSQVVVCMLQGWGDMGLLCYVPTFVMATGFACASHLPAFEAMATPAQSLAAPRPQRAKRGPLRAFGRTSPSA